MKLTRLPNAAAILADEKQLDAVISTITDEEKDGARPANFGLPAGMGVRTLKGYARTQYGQDYTDEDAVGWKESWLATYPEMAEFLRDQVDTAGMLAERLVPRPD
jgi:hypothetical protein